MDHYVIGMKLNSNDSDDNYKDRPSYKFSKYMNDLERNAYIRKEEIGKMTLDKAKEIFKTFK